jgi:hypothetical protein
MRCDIVLAAFDIRPERSSLMMLRLVANYRGPTGRRVFVVPRPLAWAEE